MGQTFTSRSFYTDEAFAGDYRNSKGMEHDTIDPRAYAVNGSQLPEDE